MYASHTALRHRQGVAQLALSLVADDRRRIGRRWELPRRRGSSQHNRHLTRSEEPVEQGGSVGKRVGPVGYHDTARVTVLNAFSDGVDQPRPVFGAHLFGEESTELHRVDSNIALMGQELLNAWVLQEAAAGDQAVSPANARDGTAEGDQIDDLDG